MKENINDIMKDLNVDLTDLARKIHVHAVEWTAIDEKLRNTEVGLFNQKTILKDLVSMCLIQNKILGYQQYIACQRDLVIQTLNELSLINTDRINSLEQRLRILEEMNGMNYED